jgi:predicted Zn finger-like uncharacterized protein
MLAVQAPVFILFINQALCMILTCPQCATRYRMEDDRFPSGGGNVRCTKCGHGWFQEAPAIALEPALDSVSQPEPPFQPPAAPPSQPSPEEWHRYFSPPPPQPSPEDLRRSAFVPPPPPPPTASAKPQAEVSPPGATRDNRLFIGGLIALAAVVALIIWAGVRYRDEISRAWPQSSAMYAALGMPVHVPGLTFTDVNYRRDTQSGRLVLTVEGNLVNAGSRELDVPAIEVTLTDANRREVDRWVFSPGANHLEPGEKLAFSTQRTNPPEDARNLDMTLAQAGS